MASLTRPPPCKLTLRRSSYHTSYPVITGIPSKLPGLGRWEMLNQYLLAGSFPPATQHLFHSCFSVLLFQRSSTFTHPLCCLELTCQLRFTSTPTAPNLPLQYKHHGYQPAGYQPLCRSQCVGEFAFWFLHLFCFLCSPRPPTPLPAPVFFFLHCRSGMPLGKVGAELDFV